MRVLLVVFTMMSSIACASLSRYCDDTPPPLSSTDSVPQALLSGQYEIQFKATGGTSKGNSASGQLWLAPIDPSVRQDGHPLYGWLNADLSLVDAPICSDDEPAPMSRDPLNPGVLVTTERDGHQVLTVANAGHKYHPGYVTFDGCGIILYIDQADSATFSGRWGAYGIIYNGCGYFQARRTGS